MSVDMTGTRMDDAANHNFPLGLDGLANHNPLHSVPNLNPLQAVPIIIVYGASNLTPYVLCLI